MRMVDLIEKKRDGAVLSAEEINFLFKDIRKAKFLIIRPAQWQWRFSSRI